MLNLFYNNRNLCSHRNWFSKPHGIQLFQPTTTCLELHHGLKSYGSSLWTTSSVGVHNLNTYLPPDMLRNFLIRCYCVWNWWKVYLWWQSGKTLDFKPDITLLSPLCPLFKNFLQTSHLINTISCLQDYLWRLWCVTPWKSASGSVKH